MLTVPHIALNNGVKNRNTFGIHLKSEECFGKADHVIAVINPFIVSRHLFLLIFFDVFIPCLGI